MVYSVAVEEALLVLKIAFLVLLYLFIWRIVRSAARDVRMPQESFILAPGSVPGLSQEPVETGRLVVLKSPALAEGDELELDSSPLRLGREIVSLTVDGAKHELDDGRAVIGRSKDCDIQLADPNVSRKHAEVRQEGAAYWVVDLDSTNGVESKGKRVKRLKLDEGTRFTVGSTELTFAWELA